VTQEPGHGIENTPLSVQPHINVGGAQPDHELPIQVVLVRADGTEDVLEGPFNAAFGLDVKFQDIAIPEIGNFTLRFELVVTSCDDIDETVVAASAETARFNVTECLFPSPVACPEDIVVVNKQHECSAFVNVPLPTSSKCSATVITHSRTTDISDEFAHDNFPVGDSFVTYTVSNLAGVSDTCQVKVTVLDVTAPVISCPAPVTVSTDAGQCGAVVALSPATATDNCDDADVDIDSDFTGSFFPLGTTTVTFTATDEHGNVDTCSTTVTVVDNEAPSITCPANVVLGCDALPNFHAPSGVDNCPGAQTFQRTGPVVGTTIPLPPGTSTFEFEVIDAQGERATCTFTATTQANWYLDADGDGVGQISEPIVQCPSPGPNFVEDSNSDCDDTNPILSVLLFPDADEDGFGNVALAVCSSPDDLQVKRSVAEVALIRLGGDCDDTNPLINPGQLELCNGFDDNCNGVVDEGCTVPPSPSSTTVPEVPVAPAQPVPSEATVIVLPTPLPRSPPAPPVVVINVQPATRSSGASLVAGVAAVALGLVAALVM